MAGLFMENSRAKLALAVQNRPYLSCKACLQQLFGKQVSENMLTQFQQIVTLLSFVPLKLPQTCDLNVVAAVQTRTLGRAAAG